MKFGDSILVHYIYHWASCFSQAYTVREESIAGTPKSVCMKLEASGCGCLCEVVGDWDVNKVVNYPIQNGDSSLRTMTL